MTFHLDSQTTTLVQPEMIPGVQTGNRIPHDKYNICGIAHARTINSGMFAKIYTNKFKKITKLQ